MSMVVLDSSCLMRTDGYRGCSFVDVAAKLVFILYTDLPSA
jgi:hypothetical protein